MEKLAYGILLALAVAWLLIIVVGLVAAFPAGLVGLLALLAIGLLFSKALRDRLRSKEDGHYSRTVEK